MCKIISWVAFCLWELFTGVERKRYELPRIYDILCSISLIISFENLDFYRIWIVCQKIHHSTLTPYFKLRLWSFKFFFLFLIECMYHHYKLKLKNWLRFYYFIVSTDVRKLEISFGAYWCKFSIGLNYIIVKDSSADLGVNFKIVQNSPTVKAVCTKISFFFCIFVNIFVFLRENKEASFFLFWIFKLKQP